MKKNRLWKERVSFFLIGILMALSLLILTGAGSGGNVNGRYLVSAWATAFGEDAGGCGAFIVDTATGKTKTAYTVIYGTPPQRSVLVNNLRKPFNSIR